MMKRLLCILIIVAVIVMPASASIIDDIFAMFTVPSPTSPTQSEQLQKWQNESYPYGNASMSINSEGIATVSYSITEIPPNGGIVVEIGTFDSAGYIMPIWGASAWKTSDTITGVKLDPVKTYYTRVYKMRRLL